MQRTELKSNKRLSSVKHLFKNMIENFFCSDFIQHSLFFCRFCQNIWTIKDRPIVECHREDICSRQVFFVIINNNKLEKQAHALHLKLFFSTAAVTIFQYIVNRISSKSPNTSRYKVAIFCLKVYQLIYNLTCWKSSQNVPNFIF